MRDKIFLTYVITDVLFLASGALLIIFALKSKAEAARTPTVKHVARDLLLMQCPLNGQHSHPSLGQPYSIQNSGGRKCRHGLRHVPNLRTSDDHAHDSRLAQVPRIHGRRLRPIHMGYRPGYLV